jgi:hypothetical protein
MLRAKQARHPIVSVDFYASKDRSALVVNELDRANVADPGVRCPLNKSKCARTGSGSLEASVDAGEPATRARARRYLPDEHVSMGIDYIKRAGILIRKEIKGSVLIDPTVTKREEHRGREATPGYPGEANKRLPE